MRQSPLPQSASAVIITRNRKPELMATLDRLTPLLDSGELAEVIVVDNASSDGSAEAVALAGHGIRLLAQQQNLGAVGRNVGVEAARSPVIAFTDDDSWWQAGSLARAARLFADDPQLGLVHARLLVEPTGAVDPICEQMATGVRRAGLPGPSIMGHLACASVVRRDAFLEVGGYSPLLGFGGEEALLSLDLADHGWAQCYVDAIVAHHDPSPRREPGDARRARCRRNDTITALLRLPAPWALEHTARLLADAVSDRALRRELVPLGARLPVVLRERRRVSPAVSEQWLSTRSAAAAP